MSKYAPKRSSHAPRPSLGQRIFDARQERGLTQKELADPDLTASYISHIESGKSRPSLKTLRYLSERLGLPMTYFLSGEEVAQANDTPTHDATAAIVEAHILFLAGRYHECAALLAPLIETLPPAAQVSGLTLLGRAQIGDGAAQDGMRTLEGARQTARTANDTESTLLVDVARADAFARAGQADTALSVLRPILAAARSTTDLVRLARIVAVAAAVLGSAGEYVQVGDVAKEYADALGLSQTPAALATALADGAPHYAAALTRFTEGLVALAELHLVAGDVYAERTDPTAQAAYDAALQASVLSDDAGLRVRVRLAQLRQAQKANDNARVAQLVAEIEGRAEVITDPSIGVGLALATAVMAGEDAHNAERHYQRAMGLAQKADNALLVTQAAVAYSRALFEWGRAAEAFDILSKATPVP